MVLSTYTHEPREKLLCRSVGTTWLVHVEMRKSFTHKLQILLRNCDHHTPVRPQASATAEVVPLLDWNPAMLGQGPEAQEEEEEEGMAA